MSIGFFVLLVLLNYVNFVITNYYPIICGNYWGGVTQDSDLFYSGNKSIVTLSQKLCQLIDCDYAGLGRIVGLNVPC